MDIKGKKRKERIMKRKKKNSIVLKFLFRM